MLHLSKLIFKQKIGVNFKLIATWSMILCFDCTIFFTPCFFPTTWNKLENQNIVPAEVGERFLPRTQGVWFPTHLYSFFIKGTTGAQKLLWAIEKFKAKACGFKVSKKLFHTELNLIAWLNLITQSYSSVKFITFIFFLAIRILKKNKQRDFGTNLWG